MKRVHGSRSGERGGVAIAFFLMLVPLVVALGVAVDLLRAYHARMALQAALDAAVIAAGADRARPDDATVKKLLQAYFDVNKPVTQLRDINPIPDVTPKGETVTYTATGIMDTYFMRVIQINHINIGASVEAQVAKEVPIHLALVVDVTASMENTPVGGVKKKIETLREASAELIRDILKTSNRSKVALIPYSGNVRLYPENELPSPVPAWIDPRSRSTSVCTKRKPNPTTNTCEPYTYDCDKDGRWTTNGCTGYRNCRLGDCIETTSVPSLWSGCIGPRVTLDPVTKGVTDIIEHISNPTDPKYQGVPRDTFQCSNSPVIELTDNETRLVGAANALRTGGDTYIPNGLIWGWNALQAGEPLDTESVAAFEAKDDGRKILVLMTDGMNSLAIRTSDGYLVKGNATQLTDVNTRTSDICTKIRADGIEIFTVMFDLPLLEGQTVVDKNSATYKMLAGCTTDDPTKTEKAYLANSHEGLLQAFRDIANSIRPVKLTK
jgi:Flp pilus assembly protein TadG